MVECKIMFDGKLLVIFKLYYIIFDYMNDNNIIYNDKFYNLEYFKKNNLIFYYDDDLYLYEKNLEFGLDETNVLFLNLDITIIYDEILNKIKIYKSIFKKQKNILGKEYYVYGFGELLYTFNSKSEINIC